MTVSELRVNCHRCRSHSGASQEERIRETSRLPQGIQAQVMPSDLPPGTKRARAPACISPRCRGSQGSTFPFGGETPPSCPHCNINNEVGAFMLRLSHYGATLKGYAHRGILHCAKIRILEARHHIIKKNYRKQKF